MRNIAVVIQARVASTRVHEKVLAEITGHPMLAHVAEPATHGRNEGLMRSLTRDRIADGRS